jgi:phosphomannomutase
MSDANINDIFKAYDVRGIYPNQLNEQIAYRIGEAYTAGKKPRRLAVGRDVRSSGEKLQKQLVSALVASGVDVVDIGVITTDQLYFAVGQYGFDGGISVTASHNPGEYNGFKFSDKGGAPISSESLTAMRDWAASDEKIAHSNAGKISHQEILEDYINHVLGYIDPAQIKPLAILANANFGAVGRALDKISDRLAIKLEHLNWDEDGTFPKGAPNPLLPENQHETIAVIKATKPDLGVAWDADADRVFFFTGDGTFIPSAYIIALLAPEFLKKYPGSKIVHDVTTAWVMDDAIKAGSGIPVMNRTGHTFMKSRMRIEDAPFAGESSGHYYFRDSFYADNGVVPFLMVIQMMSVTGKTLKELVAPLMQHYKVSGEINFTVDDPQKAIGIVEKKFGSQGKVDKTDGLVVETDNWRLSVRPSNTEPLLRFNAEALDQQVLDELIEQVSTTINT